MKMTLEQYILNPMGKDNSVLNVSTRNIIGLQYRQKFDNILLREKGKIEYHLYRDQKNNIYWAHIKVPSETVEKFYYDIVFKFTANEDTKSAGSDLFKWNVNFYSNDPSFVFTYAHVFRDNKLFIEELKSKMSKEALRKEAKEKNPGNNVGYVKTIYFAYLLMENRKLNKKIRFEAEVKNFDLNYLLSQIESADIKIDKRQEEGKSISKKKKINLDDKTAKRISNYASDMSRINVSTTKKIGNIKNSASSKNNKITRTSKTTKRK